MAKQQEHDDLALQLGVLQYNTTARTCGCPSFRYGKGRPCKHMRALHDAAAMLRAAGYQGGAGATERDRAAQGRVGGNMEAFHFGMMLVAATVATFWCGYWLGRLEQQRVMRHEAK